MLSSGQVTVLLTCRFCLGMHWPTLFGTFSVLSLRSDFDEEVPSVLVTTCNAEFGWLSGSTEALCSVWSFTMSAH